MSTLTTDRGGFAPTAVTLDAGSLLRRTFATEADHASTILRVGLAAIIFPHGAQHLLGWFGGYGFTGTHGWMVGLGFPPALAALAILTEFFAPFALLLGIAGRIAALGVAGLMVGAASTHLEHGFFMNWFGSLPPGAEGYEYHLLVILIAVAVVIRGSGALSIDRLLTRRAGRPGEPGTIR